jgi:hypothetical protein
MQNQPQYNQGWVAPAPQNPQQLTPQPYLEYKMIALWLIICAWITGVFGALLTVTVIGAIFGIPLLFAAFLMHLLGIVFLAMIRVK